MRKLSGAVSIYSKNHQAVWDSTSNETIVQPNGERPKGLSGKFMNLDPTSVACAIAAQQLLKTIEPVDEFRTGIVLVSAEGNASMREEYMTLFAQQRISPIRFAASSFNATTAVAAAIVGSRAGSLVIGGANATFARGLEIANAKLKSGSLDVVIVGECVWSGETREAACILIAYSSASPTNERGRQTTLVSDAGRMFLKTTTDRYPRLQSALEIASSEYV